MLINLNSEKAKIKDEIYKNLPKQDTIRPLTTANKLTPGSSSPEKKYQNLS